MILRRAVLVEWWGYKPEWKEFVKLGNQKVETAITDTKFSKEFCYEREQRNGEEARGGKLIALPYT